MIVTGSVTATPKMRTIASARRPDADRTATVQADGLHVEHPARLALDVGQHLPDTLDRCVDDDDRADRFGRFALGGLGEEPVDGVADARADQPEPDQAADHRITVRQVVTPAATISSRAFAPSPGSRSTAAIASVSTAVSNPSRTASSAVALTQ